MTPEQLARAGTEHAEQCALFCWAALQSDFHDELQLMFAIPNGGMRDTITAANLKAEGVKANVSDIFLPVPRAHFHGFFLELKKKGGKPTPGQLEFIAVMKNLGYAAGVFVGWQAARDALIQYLNWR